MTIAWASFTPMSAFLGGCLIGLAALLLMMFQGRIMGVSGIIGGLFGTASPAERGWRLAFLLGAVAGPIIWQAVTKHQSSGRRWPAGRNSISRPFWLGLARRSGRAVHRDTAFAALPDFRHGH